MSPTTRALIEKQSRASLNAPEGKEKAHRPGSETALNFSGGFDSLAALAVLDDTNLISLDFGGRFARERHFFERFNTHIIETNIVDLGLNAHSWQFMGIGSILLRQELNLAHYAFGSIMASSLPRLLRGPADQYTSGLWASKLLGTKRLNPVAGVSEIGTLDIAVQQYPLVLLDALNSVANPKEDKFLRKLQMLTAVCKDNSMPINIPEPAITKSGRKWGDSLATDLSSLYVMSRIGVQAVSDSYADGIPESIVQALPTLNLDFYHRINPHAYANVPKPIRSRIFEKLMSFGLDPFERKDWNAADRVMDLMSSQN